MLYALQLLTVMLTALTMGLAVAHALEYPGKLRLSRQEYLAVQAIYYPGFSLAGIGEALAVIGAFVVAVLTPRSDAAFWPWWIAFGALLLTHLTYWIVTHPVNNFWLRGTKLGGAGAGFFAFDLLARGGKDADWTALRDRWEYSHIARAILAAGGLLAAVMALSK